MYLRSAIRVLRSAFTVLCLCGGLDSYTHNSSQTAELAELDRNLTEIKIYETPSGSFSINSLRITKVSQKYSH